MLDLVIDELFKCKQAIRSAENNMRDQAYAYKQLIVASGHLNTLLATDEYHVLYEALRLEYVRVHDTYAKTYDDS